MYEGVKNQIKPNIQNKYQSTVYPNRHRVSRLLIPFACCHYSTDLTQSSNNIVTVINPSGVLIPAVCFPVPSTKDISSQLRTMHNCPDIDENKISSNGGFIAV